MHMKNAKTLLVALPLITGVSLSCAFLKEKVAKTTDNAPNVDFTKPENGTDVRVALDKKQTATQTIGKSGGSVSLTATDGSNFTLMVPPNALESETQIKMIEIQNLDGAPLDSNNPTAVQLEPSGILFSEMVTLSISPAKEIPIEQQIIFGYEGDGKDYHLAPVDPNDKQIKIRLFGFSGAGVGIGSGSSWGTHAGMQVASARTRLLQKFAEVTQAERRARDRGETPRSSSEVLKPILDAFKKQVVDPKVAGAEKDCKLAQPAIEDLILVERLLQLLGFADSSTGSAGFRETSNRLREIGKQCKKGSFQIVGGLDDWQTNTKVCDIMKPFELTGGGFTMKLSGGLNGTYSYSGPYAASGTGTYTISLPDGFDKPGTMTGTGDGTAGGASASGTEKYTLTPIPPCG